MGSLHPGRGDRAVLGKLGMKHPCREAVITNMINELSNCETTLIVLSKPGNKYVKPWLAKRLKEDLKRLRKQIRQANAVGII